ncbi:hypothetical protein T12_14342 [Trichinella patagoniensis]|uniref:Uncharacterized protein n=1 Tax=Trichinella patagoniensis TaxID=990121 RepID=A0A0V0ZF77_9BILA|nr:hypothetical protein T12_14342 [Trichinella patagoniensis]
MNSKEFNEMIVFLMKQNLPKENRVAQNNEILNNRAQCERIPHYNGENASYTKIQPPWIRIRGVPVVQLPCVLR